MDLTSLIGPILSLGMILAGAAIEGVHLGAMVSPTSAMIVFGGAIGAIFVAYPMADVAFAMKSLGIWLKNPGANPDEIMKDIIDLAQTARKESILALEKKRDAIKFAPLAKAVKLAVDGTDPNVIRDTLETEAHVTLEEGEVGVKFWEDCGAIAPTIGILGAVLGLMHTMTLLDRPELVGGGIAGAFVATLYGVGGANIFFIPFGKKIKRKILLDGHARAMVSIGIDGILSGLNPKVIEEKLLVFCHGHHGEE